MSKDIVKKLAEDAEKRRSARVDAHAQKYPHIVDQLILERAKKLTRSRWWPVYRFFLNKLLGYKPAKKMVDEAGQMPAFEAMRYASDMLKLDIRVTGLEHIPHEGAFILAPNHPTGIADGIAIFDALKDIRPDMRFFANQDAVRLNPNLAEMIIGVPWRDSDKSMAGSRATLVETAKTMKARKALILFPSGRLAYMNDQKQLTEQPWMNTVAAVPKKYDIPIIPVHITSRNSWLYYWFWKINEELRDITLFHELLNKKGQTFRIRIGEAIFPSDLTADNDKAAAELRDYVSHGLSQDLSWPAYRASQPIDN
ncbi:MAG: 1-acyl-sn-glycerol-3-phosphate acyltransferase [bacterium]